MIDWYGVLVSLVFAVALVLYMIPWFHILAQVFDQMFPVFDLNTLRVKKTSRVRVISDVLLTGVSEEAAETAVRHLQTL
jgi:hypothetical protein